MPNQNGSIVRSVNSRSNVFVLSICWWPKCLWLWAMICFSSISIVLLMEMCRWRDCEWAPISWNVLHKLISNAIFLSDLFIHSIKLCYGSEQANTLILLLRVRWMWKCVWKYINVLVCVSMRVCVLLKMARWQPQSNNYIHFYVHKIYVVWVISSISSHWLAS